MPSVRLYSKYKKTHSFYKKNISFLSESRYFKRNYINLDKFNVKECIFLFFFKMCLLNRLLLVHEPEDSDIHIFTPQIHRESNPQVWQYGRMSFVQCGRLESVDILNRAGFFRFLPIVYWTTGLDT